MKTAVGKMRRCSACFSVFVAALMLTSVGGSTARAEQEIRIVNSTIHFGSVTQNKILTGEFFIKSIGDEPAKVTMLWSGCGCTEVTLTDSTIAPGDSLRIPIRFSTGRMQGPVVKQPEVQTTADPGILIKLSILANVIMKPEDGSPVVLLPEVVDVSQFSEKVRRMDRFTLQNKSSEDLRVIVTDTALRSVEIKVDSVLPAGATIEGKLRVKDNRIESDFEESVTLLLKGKQEHYYSLPVFRRYRPTGLDDK